MARANSGDRHYQTAVSRKRDQPVMPAGTDGNNKTQDCEQGRRRTANLVIKRPIVEVRQVRVEMRGGAPVPGERRSPPRPDDH